MWETWAWSLGWEDPLEKRKAIHSSILAWRIPWSSNFHFTCLLRNLYAGQETTVRTRHGTTDWLQIGKGIRQGCILLLCLFNLMQSTSWKMLGWMKHKLESRLPGEISITSDMQMTPPLCRKWRRTKEPLDESERGEWKSRLKTQYSEN